MGYYTQYSLEIRNAGEEEVTNIFTVLRDEIDEARDAFDENGNCVDNVKWYDSTQELAEFSKKFPNVLFILRGLGEQNSDIWKEHIVNGEVTHYNASIVFEDGEVFNGI